MTVNVRKARCRFNGCTYRARGESVPGGCGDGAVSSRRRTFTRVSAPHSTNGSGAVVTRREHDGYREIMRRDVAVGGHDWSERLALCAADVSLIPDACVVLQRDTGNPPTVAATSTRVRDACTPVAGTLLTGADVAPLAVRSMDLFHPTVAGAGSLRELGFSTVHLFPVTRAGDWWGDLLLLCDRIPGRLGVREAAATAFLADLAGMILANDGMVRAARLLAAQLETALESRVAVEQAKGFLAGRDGVDVNGAFRVLRETARRERRPMVDVAREVIDPKR